MEVSVNNTLKMRVNITLAPILLLLLLLLLLLVVVGCKTVNIKNTYDSSYKSKALELVILSKDSKKHSIQKDNIRISEELISFHDIGMFFIDSLLAEGFVKSEFADLNNFNSAVDMTLKELTTNPKSNVHIFYSNEIKNIFFIEVIIDSRRKIKYEEATQGGSSIGYMFKKHPDSVILVGKIKIHHS